MSRTLRVALCQMGVGRSKADNIKKAVDFVGQAAGRGAELVVLPECFNCPYGTKYFAEYSEEITPSRPAAWTGACPVDAAKSPSVAAMSEVAKAHGVWLIAGSIPEQVLPAATSSSCAKPLYFNSSIFFSPDGQIANVQRKVHLFKINTETVKFDESEVLTAGDSANAVDIKAPTSGDLRVGVGICFDIRYPLMASHYQAQGTSLLVYPGAFNMVTGPAHWELAARSRAVDNQQFVAVCSPARDPTAEYVAWGHSMVVDPWGEVVAQAKEGEELLVADLDLAKIASTRQRLPILAGLRKDAYNFEWKL